jgi:hypothetical protein
VTGVTARKQNAWHPGLRKVRQEVPCRKLGVSPPRAAGEARGGFIMKLATLACLSVISLTSISSAGAQEMSEIEWGIDRLGNDFRTIRTPRLDPTLCRDECAADERCVAWTFVPNDFCFLKEPSGPDNTVPVASLNNDVVSGVKSVILPPK